MDFKGTKGNWTKYTAEMPSIDKPTKHSVYVGTKRIALCYDLFDVDKSKNIHEEEAEANARLIAASKELLEACKFALEQINTGTGLMRTDLLEDAINKALGKS